MCNKLDTSKISEIFNKLFLIKCIDNDLNLQSQNLFAFIQLLKSGGMHYLDKTTLLNIYDSNVVESLYTLLLSCSNVDFNICMISVLCSYDNTKTHNEIISKLCKVVQCVTSIDDNFQFIQLISNKNSSLMSDMCNSNLLDLILEKDTESKEILEKSIILCILNMKCITLNHLESINRFSSKNVLSVSGKELFLKLISASSLSSYFTIEALQSEIMWQAILDNLVSHKSINRKRAVYWLNRSLNQFREKQIEMLLVQLNDAKLFLEIKEEVYSEILLLIDSLEEKQTHIILPTLPKIDILKKFYNRKVISAQWLLVIIEKASLHESTVILKWAVTQFLEHPVDLSTRFYFNVLKGFFSKTFNSSNLFFSPDSIIDHQGFFVNELLTGFLRSLFIQFCQPESHPLFIEFLDLISSISWNSQALLFFSESFSLILCSPSELSISVLFYLSKLCLTNLPTYDVKYRKFISVSLLLGFFNNHEVDLKYILDYVRVFHTTFDINTILIPNKDLMKLILNKFLSASSADQENTYKILLSEFKSIEMTESRLESVANKITGFAFFFSIFFHKLPETFFLEFLENLIKSIYNSVMNPYANFNEIIKSIICIKELHVIALHENLSNKLKEEMDSLIMQIMRSLSHQIEIYNDKGSQEFYLQIMRYFVRNFPENMVKIYSLESNSNSPLSTVIGANLNCLLIQKSIIDFPNVFENSKFFLPIDYEKFNFFSKNINFFVDKFIDEREEKIFTVFSELLDISSDSNSLIAVLSLIGAFLEKFLNNVLNNNLSNVIQLIKSSWSRLLEFLTNAQKFWKIYSVFLEKIFLSILQFGHFTDEENRIEIVLCLNEIIESIFEIGENKFGMVHIFGSHFHDFLSIKGLSIEQELIDFYLNLLCKMVLFGPCHRRGLRFENRIDRYLSEKYSDRWNYELINRAAESSDRVPGLLVLCFSDVRIISNRFRERIIVKLKEIDEEFLLSNKTCYKNYTNNRIHRSRHRLFSTVLICVKLSENSMSSDCSELLEQWMLKCIEKETLISIRHLAEWILVLIFFRDIKKFNKVIDLIRQSIDIRPAYVCSLITISRHLIDVCHVPIENTDQLILALLPLGSAQNYNVRLYALSFISVVQNLGLVSKFSHSLKDILFSYISFIHRSSSGKNVEKLINNFWWSAFNPQHDVCLETVFSILPQLFELVEEEIISVDQFSAISNSDHGRYLIEFQNKRVVWKNCQDSVWRVKVETEESRKTGKVFQDNDSWTIDVQKKIQPWLTSRPDEDFIQELILNDTHVSDSVLVCSLLDKPTNLGGLARTSDVFGVGEFVVNNLRIVDDNNFKQLAVTADKWINMTEVPVHTLLDFIVWKRLEGFEIIGIEQTANSVPLQSMSFNPKTVFILGNEKEGIPAELISHLDRCVEIPQSGQIRSLNVHVTGAIVLWEYTKQMRHSPK